MDLIVDKSLINIIRKVLISKGYTESTFIHPRMPFYKFLLKEVPDRYIRFYKGKIAIECHVTEFQFINNLLVIDLYPKIKVSISIEYITKSVYENVEFSTVNVNLLFIIKNFLNNTLGYFVRYKSLQRQIDLYYLSKLIDMNEVKNINNDSRLRIWRLSIKLPFFLIKMRSR